MNRKVLALVTGSRSTPGGRYKLMHAWSPAVLCVLSSAALAPPAVAQSIQADGNIETGARLVSKATTGTAPLVVSSSSMVSNLNADQVDGLDGTDLALEADLRDVEGALLELGLQVSTLGVARVSRTGQKNCFTAAGGVVACGFGGASPGQDGDFRLGVTWPNPRFTKNGDGTVTDNLTRLIWLETANCFETQTWANALAKANALFDGCSDCGGTGNDCGLSDGSLEGEWRLPNARELQSLAHYGVTGVAVPNTTGTGPWSEGDPFSDVQRAFLGGTYWSSSSFAQSPATAWIVNLGATTLGWPKSLRGYVWPVRGGP